VLSSGKENERRDRETKLKLYSIQGVQEYWIRGRLKRVTGSVMRYANRRNISRVIPI